MRSLADGAMIGRSHTSDSGAPSDSSASPSDGARRPSGPWPDTAAYKGLHGYEWAFKEGMETTRGPRSTSSTRVWTRGWAARTPYKALAAAE